MEHNSAREFRPQWQTPISITSGGLIVSIPLACLGPRKRWFNEYLLLIPDRQEPFTSRLVRQPANDHVLAAQDSFEVCSWWTVKFGTDLISLMKNWGHFREIIRQPDKWSRIDEGADRDSDHGRYYNSLLKELVQSIFPSPLSFAWLRVTMMNSSVLPQIHFIQCLETHANYGVPIWTASISYKALIELVRYYMVRIYAFSILIGVEPYLSKGKQWPPLVQWGLKEIRSEPNKGLKSTCENVWNIQQRDDVVAKMLFSPFTRNTGQRIVPMTTFPSLECAKAKLEAGGVEHAVHQVCLQAIEEEAGVAISSKDPRSVWEHNTRTEPLTKHLQSISLSISWELRQRTLHLKVPTISILTPVAQSLQAKQVGTIRNGQANSPQEIPRDPNEAIPPLAIPDADVSSSEEETLVPFKTER